MFPFVKLTFVNNQAGLSAANIVKKVIARMINYIVVGKNKEVVTAVLRSIKSFTEAKSIVLGGRETRRLSWSSLCQEQFTLHFDGSQDEYFVSLVAHYAEKMPQLTLIPADAEAIRMVNRVRGRIAVPMIACPDAMTFELLNDNDKFRTLCQRHRLPVLRQRFLQGQEAGFEQLASELGLPFLVRSARHGFGNDQYLISSSAEYDRLVGGRSQRTLLAQEYIPGADVALNLLVDRGQVTTLAVQREAGARVKFEDNQALQDMGAQLCQLTAYSGVLHLQARVEHGSGRVFLTGATPHFWPSLPASVGCGLNFVAESIQRTSRQSGMRVLEAGSFMMRQPLLHVSNWGSLLVDEGQKGRLLRAMVFDGYALTNYVRDLPAALMRHARRYTLTHRRMQKKLTDASLAMEAAAEQASAYLGSRQA